VKKRSLKQYVADLKPNQTEIYFPCRRQPAERLKIPIRGWKPPAPRGIEVLLLTDAVDAFWTSAQLEFEGKPLKSLSQGPTSISISFRCLTSTPRNTPKTEAEPAADEADTIAIIKANLGDPRHTDVKSVDTTADHQRVVPGRQRPQGRNRELERLLSQQNRGVRTKPILGDQPAHPPGDGRSPRRGSEAKNRRRPCRCCCLEQAQIPRRGELPEDPGGLHRPAQTG